MVSNESTQMKKYTHLKAHESWQSYLSTVASKIPETKLSSTWFVETSGGDRDRVWIDDVDLLQKLGNPREGM